MPKFEKKVTPAVKKTRTRRPVVVMLAKRIDAVSDTFNTETPWEGQIFTSVEKAIAATSSNPEFCQINSIRAITISPRIIPKTYVPRKPVMVFDTSTPEPVPAYNGLSNGPSPEGINNAVQ